MADVGASAEAKSENEQISSISLPDLRQSLLDTTHSTLDIVLDKYFADVERKIEEIVQRSVFTKLYEKTGLYPTSEFRDQLLYQQTPEYGKIEYDPDWVDNLIKECSTSGDYTSKERCRENATKLSECKKNKEYQLIRWLCLLDVSHRREMIIHVTDRLRIIVVNDIGHGSGPYVITLVTDPLLPYSMPSDYQEILHLLLNGRSLSSAGLSCDYSDRYLQELVKGQVRCSHLEQYDLQMVSDLHVSDFVQRLAIIAQIIIKYDARILYKGEAITITQKYDKLVCESAQKDVELKRAQKLISDREDEYERAITEALEARKLHSEALLEIEKLKERNTMQRKLLDKMAERDIT